jgi:hypothetical protein
MSLALYPTLGADAVRPYGGMSTLYDVTEIPDVSRELHVMRNPFPCHSDAEPGVADGSLYLGSAKLRDKATQSNDFHYKFHTSKYFI